MCTLIHPISEIEKTNFYKSVSIITRNNNKDMWNAFMVKGAGFSAGSDIPFCNGSVHTPPKKLIAYEDAKHLYKEKMKQGLTNFFIDAFIHFYTDEQNFDGKQSSIWLYPLKAKDIIEHFAGIITPDFSTYADFPDPWKRFNTYRMRAFGYWITTFNIPVINNVRWGTIETWNYCFDGIPKNGIVSIGTVASGLRKVCNRPLFEDGLIKMVDVLMPHTILVYGSANYPCFKELQEQGINIIVYLSKTNLAHKENK